MTFIMSWHNQTQLWFHFTGDLLDNKGLKKNASRRISHTAASEVAPLCLWTNKFAKQLKLNMNAWYDHMCAYNCATG